MKKLALIWLLLSSLAYGATQLTYAFNVNVKDNDLGPCGATFVVTSSLPRGWKAVYSPASLSLASGQSGVIQTTFTVPKNATAGSYPVTITVTNSSNKKYKATVRTNVTVF